ncbi:hypothetical protein [Cupriavidus sp. TMH.W2]|uniref:hypothetical protein n=1 Tax=Cupriavidus sp. TMH.W2 TaxID=3434465 RepID=UPI003D77727E
MQTTLTFSARHLILQTSYRRYLPFAQIEELSLSQLMPDEGKRWVVVADLDGGETARLGTFAPDAETEALMRLRSWADAIFGGIGQAGPVPARATSEPSTASVQGQCLCTVSAWGTRYLRRTRVREIYLVQSSARDGGRWEVAADLPDGRTCSLQSFAPHEQAAAEANADRWAAQMFASCAAS